VVNVRLVRACVSVVLPALLVSVALAGCGGSSGPSFPTVGAARVYEIVKFEPAGKIEPGKATPISFEIKQPDGTPLTKFKRGPGPHTGVHLIYVRKDLSTIIHHHPPVDSQGVIHDQVTFPDSGPYRLVIDVYPASGSTGANGAPPASAAGAPAAVNNFQLFRTVKVAGTYAPRPLPPTTTADTVDGHRFTLTGATNLKAIQARLVHVNVTEAQGKPAVFDNYYGARAHAIFFRKGSLDYFHTHVCAPGATGCTSILGATKVTGTSSTPGKLTVGVLVPVPGTWRLFLQVEIGGRIVTAPFTLKVS